MNNIYVGIKKLEKNAFLLGRWQRDTQLRCNCHNTTRISCRVKSQKVERYFFFFFHLKLLILSEIIYLKCLTLCLQKFGDIKFFYFYFSVREVPTYLYLSLEIHCNFFSFDIFSCCRVIWFSSKDHCFHYILFH